MSAGSAISGKRAAAPASLPERLAFARDWARRTLADLRDARAEASALRADNKELHGRVERMERAFAALHCAVEDAISGAAIEMDGADYPGEVLEVLADEIAHAFNAAQAFSGGRDASV